MKIVYVEARYKKQITLPDSVIKKLPAKVALFCSVQFLGSIPGIRKQLEKNGKTALTFKTRHTMHDAQLLGCNIDEFKADYDAFLYIGDGLFHPYALVLKNSKPAFLFDPFMGTLKTITEKDTERWLKQRKVAYVKFMHSDVVGVLATTKPGQNNLRLSFQLEKLFPEKQFYFIVDNTFNFDSLENFPFIQCFVNTACPRISYEDYDKLTKPIINIEDIAEKLRF